jgi:hypothetical protein
VSERLASQVEALARLDLHQLRHEWQQRFGPVAMFRSTELLRLMLAWRIQATALGGLDPDTRKVLVRKGVVEPEGRQLGVGATLRREWQGSHVVVTVIDDGFTWDGRQFRSLSAVATAIAGSKWNGPRVFGLRR